MAIKKLLHKLGEHDWEKGLFKTAPRGFGGLSMTCSCKYSVEWDSQEKEWKPLGEIDRDDGGYVRGDRQTFEELLTALADR